jgi:hypothetical protein
MKPVKSLWVNCCHKLLDESEVHTIYVDRPHVGDRIPYTMCTKCFEIKGDMSFQDWVDEMWARQRPN